MSDDEEYDSEEEEEESEADSDDSQGRKKGPKNELEAKVVLTGEALEKKLKVWIGEWRSVRSKEDEVLNKLKAKQEKRKVVRAEENKKLEEKQAIEEKRRQKEVEDKKKADNAEKMAKLEEAEKRRQAILKAEAEKAKSGANYLIQKKAEDVKADPAAEFKKTKEQLAEEKKVALQIRVKPLALEGLKIENLREMATDMWTQLVLLETEKYDFEERSKRQDYDLKELKEKNKQQLKQKALKLGLDPE
jgi:troponin T